MNINETYSYIISVKIVIEFRFKPYRYILSLNIIPKIFIYTLQLDITLKTNS